MAEAPPPVELVTVAVDALAKSVIEHATLGLAKGQTEVVFYHNTRSMPRDAGFSHIVTAAVRKRVRAHFNDKVECIIGNGGAYFTVKVLDDVAHKAKARVQAIIRSVTADAAQVFRYGEFNFATRRHRLRPNDVEEIRRAVCAHFHDQVKCAVEATGGDEFRICVEIAPVSSIDD